jgi:hypothetical protein
MAAVMSMTIEAADYRVLDSDASGILVTAVTKGRRVWATSAPLRIARSLWEQLAPEQRRNLVARLHGVQELVGETQPLRLDIASPSTAVPDGAGELEAALTEARGRGEQLAARILNGPEMLSSDAFARRIGVTRETVRQKLARHEILGLSGAKRGVRFPAWQVMDDGRLLRGLPELFARLGHAWTVYRFLVQQQHPELGRRTALAALKDGDVEAVLSVAEASSYTMA